MHDGQNLFDNLHAFGSEWGIDETLNAEEGKVVVIGIENGAGQRMAEYMLHDHPEHCMAEGALYLKDICEIIMPDVDSLLCTKSGRENTSIAGSSMGGLISLYAGLYFPHLFGTVGIFSPAIWLDLPSIFTEVQAVAMKNMSGWESNSAQRWYFYAGTRETETLVAEVETMVTIFRQYPQMEVTYQIDAGGIHDEAVWKNYFPEFYTWLIEKKPSELLELESDIKIV
ncbi:MAG: alpha/beta hydrolase-fold protein [Ferruginibacter sp.]